MKFLVLIVVAALILLVAFALAVAIAVVRLRRKNAGETDDPLGMMFRENEAAYAERQREAVAALPADEPLREWVARGGDIGWLGFSDYLCALYFDEKPDQSIGNVRAVRYAGHREPNLKRLPAVEQPFGVDLSQVRISDRVLTALADHHNLVALSVEGKSDVNDASLKIIKQMVDLTMLDVRFTEITGHGLRHLTELPKLRYLALSLPELGEAVDHLRRMTQLVVIGGNPMIGDNDLRALAPLTNLTHLDLSAAVTDAGLKHLHPFGRLIALKLGAGVTDAGFVHLKSLGALQKLTISTYSQGVCGAGLNGLLGLNELWELNLSGNALRIEGLDQFAGLPRLKQLHLDHNPISDAGLACMRLPVGLELLNLGWTKGTDDGIAQLQLPPTVTSLNLYELPITDASVPHLARFTSLQRLNIAQTRFTLDGAQRLSESLPNCTIQTSFPN